MTAEPGPPQHGVDWANMKIGAKVHYPGTVFGLKSSVCRANRRYKPIQFKWYWGGRKLDRLFITRVR